MAEVKGVPETISREAYLRLIRSVGLDPDQLLSLTFGSRSIEAEVFALDEQGRHYAEGNEIAKHHYRIKVVDDDG